VERAGSTSATEEEKRSQATEEGAAGFWDDVVDVNTIR